ncbi:MAG: major capsid protein [Candidatus Azobacteroides sp.]|nr:major capsid protein [Candidatus Azobacteroides sp.]
MNPTLFVEFVAKWFKTLASRIVEKINDSKSPVTYLFKTMLRIELSPDLKWESLNVNKSIVAADVVAMDSPLPLKKRDSIAMASGVIPKLGMKMQKSEKLLTDIQVMKARGATEAQIVQKIFEDVPRVITGIYERIEYMFLKALSTGTMLVPNEENVGAGIRVQFGYKPSNRFGVKIKWGNKGYEPVSDISRVITRADGNFDVITTIALDREQYNLIRKSDEAKALYAASIGNFTGNNQIIPIPSQFNAIMEDEYKIKFLIVDRSVRYEKDGKQTPVKPFASDTLVFLTTEQVGTLVYGILAEETTPVANVEYQKVDSYILVSKYSKNDPLREFTTSQALVLPVIENVDSIYILNTDKAQEIVENEIEGDERITVWETELVKADVIEALKTIGVKTASNISDKALIEKINKLSAEQKAALKEALGL